MGAGGLRRWMEDLAADVADLTLSRACVACGEIGSVLCSACKVSLIRVHRHEIRPWGTPSPHQQAGAGPVVVASTKRVIIAHKEHGVLGLTQVLGSMLAVSIAALGEGPFAVVPIPPHRDAVRRRGIDTLGAIADRATGELRAAGWCANAVPLLRRRADGGRHVGRSAPERRAAVQDTMAVDARMISRLVLGEGLIVVDDVVTTGATVWEAVRTLWASGLAVEGIAAVAGTERPAAPGRVN